MTPWVHILVDHILVFETIYPVRPVLLTCHAIEGHHRQIKRDFGHSLHSTKRKFGRSGLVDIVDIDNVILSLIGMKIFPWERLHIQLGSILPPIPRGLLYNNLKIQIRHLFRINVLISLLHNS